MIKVVRTILLMTSLGLVVLAIITLMNEIPKWYALLILAIFISTGFSFLVKTQ